MARRSPRRSADPELAAVGVHLAATELDTARLVLSPWAHSSSNPAPRLAAMNGEVELATSAASDATGVLPTVSDMRLGHDRGAGGTDRRGP